MVRKYRKKPVVIEAIQIHPHNFEELEEFVGGDLGNDSEGHLVIATLEGPMQAPLGHYIIKGVAGEFYSCDPDIFHQTYAEES